jgi:hypothetical protein
MTSIVIWAGVDSHGPSSLYMAADSRITWGSMVHPALLARGDETLGQGRRLLARELHFVPGSG